MPGVGVSTHSIDVEVTEGSNADSVSIEFENTGDGLMDWGAADAVSWLVSSASGTDLPPGIPQTLTITFLTDDLAAGVYSGAFLVLSTNPGAMPPFQSVTVHLTVSEAVDTSTWVQTSRTVDDADAWKQPTTAQFMFQTVSQAPEEIHVIPEDMKVIPDNLQSDAHVWTKVVRSE